MDQEPENSNHEITATLVSDFGVGQSCPRVRDQLDPEQRLLLDLVMAAGTDQARFAAVVEKASRHVRGSARGQYRELAESVSAGQPIRQAILESWLLPAWCLVGLDQLLATPKAMVLGRTWERESSLPTIERQPAKAGKSRAARLFLVGIKLYIALMIFAFIMLYIVPEFRSMFEEFGIELPIAMQWMIWWADPISALLAPIIILFMAAALISCITMPWIMVGWLSRWTPFRWAVDSLPKRAKVWQALGWWNCIRSLVSTFDCPRDVFQSGYFLQLPISAQTVINAAGKEPSNSSPSDVASDVWAEAVGQANANALNGLAHDQVRTWAMLYKAAQIKQRAQGRLSRLVFAIDVLIQTVIGLLVCGVAVSVFSCLIKLIEEM